MNSLTSILLLVSLLVLVPSGAGANPGDPRVLRGVLAWAPGGDGAPFVVVQGDDGRQYVADLSGAQRRGEPVNVGERISVAGVEGARPWQMSALVVGAGDSALAALSAPPASPSTPPPPPTTAAPAPAGRPEPAPRPWRRIDGTVDAVGDTTLRLREIDGRKVTVDVSKLSGGVATTLRPGDRATVFVVAEDDRRLVAVGLVQTEAGAPALPRQPR